MSASPLPTLFSECRTYRYRLTRRIGFFDSVVNFVMLNPSMADEDRDDPTVRRVVDFGNQWHYGWLYVTNLSPFRATDPDVMLSNGPEPLDVAERNIEVITETALGADMVVVAWGTNGPAEDRDKRVLHALRVAGVDLHCLKLTQEAHPYHPLYVKKTTVPSVYLGNSPQEPDS